MPPARPSARPRLRRGASLLPVLLLLLAGMVVVGHSSPATGSRPVDFTDGSPLVGSDIFATEPGGMWMAGWDFDPNAARTPLTTYVTIDNKIVKSVVASRYETGLHADHPIAGSSHRYSFFVPVSEGTHTVCVSARNIGQGSDAAIRCVRKVYDYGPFGWISGVTTPPGSLSVWGWAVDRDAPTTPLTVDISVDGTTHVLTANHPRANVAAAYRGVGAAHGYSVTYRVGQGSHTVCVTAVNIGYGQNENQGCRTVVLNDSPTARVLQADQHAGGLRVAGWAYDRSAFTTPVTVRIALDGRTTDVLARADSAAAQSYNPLAGRLHGFSHQFTVAEGTHRVCVSVVDIGPGSDTQLPCRTVTIDFTPSAALTGLTTTATGVQITGWATDPDTTAAIPARVLIDNKPVTTVTASGAAHGGHGFSTAVRAVSGRHTVCVVGINVDYGTRNSTPSCRSVTLALSPLGAFEKAARSGTSNTAIATGWALDPDTTSPLHVAVTVAGVAVPDAVADLTRTDIAKLYPGYGARHGFSIPLTIGPGEHRICVTARNVGGGSNRPLGCRVVFAAHPVVPSAPMAVHAVGGYGSETVSWTRPASDGGAQWNGYVITASPGGHRVTVGPTATSALVGTLATNTRYSFAVQATNIAGTSLPGRSPVVSTLPGPSPQITPAPVATSRYIRNIRNGSAAELAWMRNAGVSDARNNPSGHRYLVLLDIGGQDQYDGGVVLSAGTGFVAYPVLVKDIDAYVDGYASAQRTIAPATIAIGTNNDMDVSSSSGATWANTVVDPVATHARSWSGLSIAGADDIEPGFSASYSATRSWLSGYLANTTAKFVFNGSADGCAWTVADRDCNNGWTMAGLYWLAGGAAPTRIVDLPQVYNTTMAAQWEYISLTGLGARSPRIYFGGVLTEWEACDQSGSCGSLTGRAAWSALWADLQSDRRLKTGSLPYATDLRIN